jgi:hypothetical protein
MRIPPVNVARSPAEGATLEEDIVPLLFNSHNVAAARRFVVSSPRYMPQRKAAVWTGESQSLVSLSSTRETVSEQPAISSEVT